MGYTQFSFLLFLCFCLVSFSSSIPHPCRKDQSISLLKFKQTFTIGHPTYCPYQSSTYPKTSSWNVSRDCCSWDGVTCDEMTGHVIELDLSCSQLVGNIDSNSSLFQLSHLQRLDLSKNNFSNSHISPEFGRFSSLTHLNLSESSFSGQIPFEISHISRLQSLRFSTSYATNLRLAAHDFKLLLQNLTQLTELDLSYVNISSTIPLNFSSHLTTLKLGGTGLYGIIPESIFHLPNLETLDLSENDQLNGYFPNTKWNSSASLVEIYLNEVNLSGNLLPETLGYLTSLYFLSLSNCSLGGPIPESLSNLTSLVSLDLTSNALNGTIPSWMFSHLPLLRNLILSDNHFSGRLEDFKSNSLRWIDLRNNHLQGHLPNSIQNLVNLTVLYLSFNNFSGHVDVSLFSDLKQLWVLDLSYNSISLTNENKVNFTWPETLFLLRFAACEVKELEFLRSAKQLQELDISNNKIQGRIPDWAWSNWMFSLFTLNISHNMLTSVVSTIDLRSNLLQGSLPIPPNSTSYFFISQNNLSGEIPSSICNLASLIMLDLSRNNLSGEIPQCLGNITGLEVLDMRHNNLSGNLPRAFSNGCSLTSLNLHGNKLEGKIPRSWAHCKELQVLDLGDNHLIGTFPMWLGTLPKLQVLSLRSNELHGSIRTSTVENMFPNLRMLDLSSNAFTENLPKSLFQHLKAMRTIDPSKMEPSDGYYQDTVAVVTKGLELEVVRILSLYTTVDLSNNKFGGYIPRIMGDLVALRMLNLSHNGLEGHIPPSLGNLSVVESLDLSGNHLVGEIPVQFSSLTYLEVFNLSHNHLEGCIPQGNQFATFENSSYEGNDGLRGFPVSKGCGDDHVSNTVSGLDDQEGDSEFLNDFRKAALMGYGSGLCIGLSIIYMVSTRNPIWLARILLKLEHKIITRRKKKQRLLRNNKRRNNLL
ncbi:hypothetical protein CQW23_23399 [Capsicum baccatum]|uniref:Leucine-rich repeat-containing N-terminal plant-type domain-containing protein n=1 Tax=Capsicum baccatum TaxID=33114 RepID=A0A2G2VRT9_CAPBA|nr:hypothetical protein CQW23_23399 [Capsicum baccatum]